MKKTPIPRPSHFVRLSPISFGNSVASLGDLDGDGIGGLAVGACSDDDGGDNQGAIDVIAGL